jgi:hypothetical protein
MKPRYDGMGLHLCELLGLDPSKVTHIVVDCAVSRLPIATVTTIALIEGEVVHTDTRYEIRAIEEL